MSSGSRSPGSLIYFHSRIALRRCYTGVCRMAGENFMDDIEIVIPKPADWAPRILDNLSVEALKIYVEDLERELERVKSEIGNRGVVRSEADAVFKK
ncbi:MAG TPA: DUF1192 domain-containing protein [Alphaproteobacteria bacterium]|nr:DUF1192 domain-containing protein [Alphaproteobacteria bacterium]